MKTPVLILLVLVPTLAFSQNPMGMNEADMQRMMQQMQKAQTCMEKIDQKEFTVLEQRSKQFEAEMKSLCANGKRDQAMEKAMAFSKEVSKNPSVIEMRKCGKMMKGVMPEMPFMKHAESKDKSGKSRHVCD